jgi:hypothetical protein
VSSRNLQNAACAVILAVWIASFFLPSLADGQNTLPGYAAAGLSAMALGIGAKALFTSNHSDLAIMLYLGSFCLANVFMLVSPFALRLARRGRALVILCLMGFWVLLDGSYIFYGQATKHMNLVRLGWWIWEGSLIAMTVLLYVVRHESLANRGND